MLTKPGAIYFFSFLLAFCSLTYELVFAQILSVCIGGTKTQYLITISLFTSALGIGSLIFGYSKNKIKHNDIFFYVEAALTLLGISGPFFIAWLLQTSSTQPELLIIKYFLSYFFVFTIGLLSGFEIPCLFSLDEKNQGKILAFDYLGMLFASLIFPLFALPYLGTAGTCLGAATLNLFALFWIKPIENKIYQRILQILISSIFFLVMYFREIFNNLLTEIYMNGL